jgi:NAD(P)-dependent dehydrogenase (short-subunit alcohol dehydrogenase family)
MADNATPSMTGKTVLITGGTGGIGKATAIGLARLGARVGIVGRDHARAEAAAADIRAKSGNPAVDVFAADLSSQAEVRRLAAEVLDAYPRLDVLVNNVGGFWEHRHVTADGLERTFAVNHLAPFLLTGLLRERLVASRPARVVTVSSGAQSMGRIDFDDLQSERNYSGQRAYNQSKLANVMFTYELARRLEGTGVTATAVHAESGPGRGHPRLPGLIPRGGGHERAVLRQPEAEEEQQGLVRCRGGRPPLACQRRAGRPPRRTELISPESPRLPLTSEASRREPTPARRRRARATSRRRT